MTAVCAPKAVGLAFSVWLYSGTMGMPRRTRTKLVRKGFSMTWLLSLRLSLTAFNPSGKLFHASIVYPMTLVALYCHITDKIRKLRRQNDEFMRTG